MVWGLPFEKTSWVITVFGFPIALIALWLGWRQLRLARRAASAQTMVSLHESFRQAWIRVADTPDEAKDAPLHDLLNVVELACAVVNDDVMARRTRALLVEFLCHQMVQFENHEATRGRIEEMMQTPTTFLNIREFMADNKKSLAQYRKFLVAPNGG